ncbi:uncharacterized protein LOC127752122, partial [Frankliniella occidentalis]|uniref:Uncharacterized protein LOC127752122 n=1 Tax=Frankliniella occidentalis TaxID=133901 RepID=A0A9C6XBQ9_FRAOC
MKHGAAHGDVLVDGVREANAWSDRVVGDGVAEDGVEEDSVVEDGNAEEANAEDGVVEGQRASMMEALPSELLLLVLGLLPTYLLSSIPLVFSTSEIPDFFWRVTPHQPPLLYDPRQPQQQQQQQQQQLVSLPQDGQQEGQQQPLELHVQPGLTQEQVALAQEQDQ